MSSKSTDVVSMRDSRRLESGDVNESSIPFTRFRSAWQWSFSGQARFGVMSGNGKAEARSESGPPERWRRRAFSYVYVLRFDQ